MSNNKKPTVSVKKPGVNSKAPANRIIAPCAIGSVGFSNSFNLFWISFKTLIPCVFTKNVPKIAVSKIINRVG